LIDTKGRIRDSAFGLSDLKERIDIWLARRRTADELQMHKTQLDAIGAFLNAVLAKLDSQLASLPADLDAGRLNAECRKFDLRVLWLARIWDFFREKLDQQDDAEIKDTIRLADEVIWSCYARFMGAVKDCGLNPNVSPAAPLPFIESRYSPMAFPCELVPASLTEEVDDDAQGFELLRAHLNKLPVPVVRLPPSCIGSPWWLISLGHEVGHHVQYALLPESGMIGEYRTGLVQLARNNGFSEPDAERWGAWSREIFADIFSVLCMGQGAIAFLALMEMGPEEELCRPRYDYPAPLIRLELMTRTAEKLDLDGLAPLPWPAAPLPFLQACRNLVPQVVDYTLGKLPAVQKPLEDLCGFSPSVFKEGGFVRFWRASFESLAESTPARALPNPRLLVCACLEAWLKGPGLSARRSSLADYLRAKVISSREQGFRAGLGAPAEGAISASRRQGEEFADELAELLQ